MEDKQSRVGKRRAEKSREERNRAQSTVEQSTQERRIDAQSGVLTADNMDHPNHKFYSRTYLSAIQQMKALLVTHNIFSKTTLQDVQK